MHTLMSREDIGMEMNLMSRTTCHDLSAGECCTLSWTQYSSGNPHARIKHREEALYHQSDWNFHKMIVICWTAALRTTKNWLFAQNTSCHVRFTLQPVELRICCKIAKLAGSFSEARAGQSACCLSSFFQWSVISSSVCDSTGFFPRIRRFFPSGKIPENEGNIRYLSGKIR